MVTDLPDYTRFVTINVLVPPAQQAPVIPRPTGGVLETGSLTSSGAYQTLASHVVTSGKTLELSKIVVSAETATWIKLRWNGAQIGCLRLIDDKTLLLEHFPWAYYTMLGDGAKAFDIQVLRYSANGICNAEIVGEEV